MLKSIVEKYAMEAQVLCQGAKREAMDTREFIAMALKFCKEGNYHSSLQEFTKARAEIVNAYRLYRAGEAIDKAMYEIEKKTVARRSNCDPILQRSACCCCCCRCCGDES